MLEKRERFSSNNDTSYSAVVGTSVTVVLLCCPLNVALCTNSDSGCGIACP